MEKIKVENNIWMVRAGKRGRLCSEFLEKKIVAISYGNIGDLSTISNLDDLKNVIKKAHPNEKDQTINSWAGQIYHFLFDFKEDRDYVLTYDSESREYHIGSIIGDYEYNKDLIEFEHIRKINWLGKVSRDNLSSSTRYSLGSGLTIFNLNEDVKKEIITLLYGDVSTSEPPEELEGDIEKSIEEAYEAIKDKIITLDWEQMQDLVAGLLRAMGYKTSVSERGPDKGVDITAHPDEFGIKDPKIKVQVKHRKDKSGSQLIQQLRGALKKGEKGIFVSTGGFTKNAWNEAESSSTIIKLINLDYLVDLIIKYYEDFDDETKDILPLKRIYLPA